MKNTIASALRSAALAATLLAVPALASAIETADRAAELLTAHSTVTVSNAGPYVELGTFQIQVSTKLGRPDTKLSDGTWLYSHYQVEESRAAGTLVVRFAKGRVSELSLVTPAAAIAMGTSGKASDKILVASSK
jgi:hypothetical protein